MLLVGTLESTELRVLSLPALDALPSTTIQVEDTPKAIVNPIPCRCIDCFCSSQPDPRTVNVLAGLEGIAGDPRGQCVAINAGGRVTLWPWPLNPSSRQSNLRKPEWLSDHQIYSLEQERLFRRLIGREAAEGLNYTMPSLRIDSPAYVDTLCCYVPPSQRQ